MADVSVRVARADDAAEIARLQLDTWRSAYADVLPAPVLAGLDADQATAVWRTAVTEPPSPAHHVLVAQEREWLVGFAALGPPPEHEPDEPDPERTTTLGPLLVEPRGGRRGHGSRLLAAAVDHARRDGMVRAVCWLPERDTASRSFFASAGWAADGLVRALDTGAGELREIRIHTDLGGPPA